MSEYINEYYGYKDRPIGFISIPYTTHKKEPPKYNRIYEEKDKAEFVITNKVMRKETTTAKKVLTTLISKNNSYSVTELSELLNVSYNKLSVEVAGCESLTINGTDFEVSIKTYAITLYKNGILHSENITTREASIIIGRSFKQVGTLKERGSENKDGWRVEGYEG